MPEKIITFDAHIDFPWKAWKIYKAGVSVLNSNEQARKGGLRVALFPFYMPDTLSIEDCNTGIRWQHAFFKARSRRYVNPRSVERIIQEVLVPQDDIFNFIRHADCIYIRHGLEGTKIINTAARLPVLEELGVKLVGMTHNHNLPWADSATDQPSVKGLGRQGLRIVSYCNNHGITLDVSHSSDDTAKAIIANASRPVVASHSGCRSLLDHPRNLSDELIKTVAAAGGVIGIPFVEKFIGPKRACIIDHIDHVVQTVGDHLHVGIGSDLDGAKLCEDIEVTEWKEVVIDQLSARGYTDSAIEAIAGWNFLRVIG